MLQQELGSHKPGTSTGRAWLGGAVQCWQRGGLSYPSADPPQFPSVPCCSALSSPYARRSSHQCASASESETRSGSAQLHGSEPVLFQLRSVSDQRAGRRSARLDRPAACNIMISLAIWDRPCCPPKDSPDIDNGCSSYLNVRINSSISCLLVAQTFMASTGC